MIWIAFDADGRPMEPHVGRVLPEATTAAWTARGWTWREATAAEWVDTPTAPSLFGGAQP